MSVFQQVDQFLETQGVYVSLPLSRTTLEQYLKAIEATYEDLSYHGLKHIQQVVGGCIDVWKNMGLGGVVKKTVPNDHPTIALAFVVAAAVHDAGHKGLTNDFLIRSHHPYAITYNDVSPNEQHHCATAFNILFNSHNFLEDLPPPKFALFRQTVIALVMSTDMSRHHSILSQLRSRDYTQISSNDIPVLLQAGIKCADLGHTFLPREEHVVWSRRLQQELFLEGDQWKDNGWNPSSLMDRGSSGDFAASQAGFFRYIVIPFAEAFSEALPQAARLLDAAMANVGFWQSSQQAS